MTDNLRQSGERTWRAKFGDAVRGLALGVRGQSSFIIHLPVALAVTLAAVALRLSASECSLLILCISLVLVAELFNSALERMAKAVDDGYNEALGQALDIAASAVLLASLGAVVVGILILGPHCLRLLTG